MDVISSTGGADAAICALRAALTAYDRYTAEHSGGTCALAEQVAERLGVDEEEAELVSRAAALHDVGKLGVPGDVLNKAGPLSAEELVVMREHPVIGEQILGVIPPLAGVARAVRHEHERWDGSGYPDGLAGEQIPLASRIVLACDAWHAMTSDRPYRLALPVARALGELRRGAGRQFDPDVARALLDVLRRELALST
jgi:HD-GYP domain-containing protein (c-di-GMP phosphodiesterase class II)